MYWTEEQELAHRERLEKILVLLYLKGMIDLKSVWKFKLDPSQSNIIEVPLGTKILSTSAQGDDIVVYGLVSLNEESKEVYSIEVSGTGQQIPSYINDYKFLDTVKMNNGEVIYHVFYKRIV